MVCTHLAVFKLPTRTGFLGDGAGVSRPRAGAHALAPEVGTLKRWSTVVAVILADDAVPEPVLADSELLPLQ